MREGSKVGERVVREGRKECKKREREERAGERREQ